MPSADALALFAKYPAPGRVKTRLARDIGPREAARLSEEMLRHLVSIHRGRAYDLVLCTAGASPARFQTLLDLKNREAIFHPQRGPDLGSRMHRAFRVLLGRYGRVVLVGSDTPGVGPRVVREALGWLRRVDVVLGPSRDGGYYLVAMARPHDIFSGVGWSGPRVLAQTLERVEAGGLSAVLLDERRDVDTLEDAVALGFKSRRADG